MAEEKTSNPGDNTAPSQVQSPGTFIPGMSDKKQPTGCDQKTEKGRTGKD